MKSTLWVACALALTAGAIAAAPKPESAAKALKRGAKQVAKLKSYRVDFSVSGGLAKGADHTVIESRVSESWTAEVRGGITQLNQGEVFRRRRADLAGAIKAGMHWKALLATDKGRMVGRLFKDPEVMLATALRSKKRARWLTPSTSNGPEISSEADADGGTRSGPRGGPGSHLEEGPLPTVLEVEGPAVEAIRHFEQIVSSGCFSEG